MKRLLHYILLICCTLPALQVQAQTKRIDSLKNTIRQARTDTQKTDAILALCREKYSLSGDTMHAYARLAKNISVRTQDRPRELWADYYIGYAMLTTGLLDSCIASADRHLANLSYSSQRDLYVNFAILKSMACYKGNRSKETIRMMYDLLKETQADSTSIYNIETINTIALAYSGLSQYEESVKWFYRAYRLNVQPAKTIGCVEQYARTLMGLSISYLHLFEAKNTQALADSSLHYSQRSETLCEKYEVLFFYCQALVLQGYYYSYQKQPEKAETYIKRGLSVRRIIGDPVYIASDMSVLGTFYSTTGQPDKGIAICREGIAICNKYHLTSQLFVLLYNALSQNYLAAGQYKEYGETLKQLIYIKDSIYNKTAAEEMNKLEAIYELKKNEVTIAQQQLDITKKNYLFYGLLTVALFMAIIATILFTNYKKRQHLKMDFILAEEKRLATESVREAEETQRKRIAAELHDNMGAQISFITSNIDWIVDSPRPLTEEQQKERLKTIHETSQGLMRNLRETIWALNRDEITLEEFADKLKVYIQTILHINPGIRFDSSEKLQGTATLKPLQALNLFRIFQEAVTNTLKHGKKTSRLHLDIVSYNDACTISLQDDGAGFEPASVQGEHYGLRNMHFRAKEAGFNVKVMSKPGAGTTIAVSLPG